MPLMIFGQVGIQCAVYDVAGSSGPEASSPRSRVLAMKVIVYTLQDTEQVMMLLSARIGCQEYLRLL